MEYIENVVLKADNQENSFPIKDKRLDSINLYNISYESNETISIKEVSLDERC